MKIDDVKRINAEIINSVKQLNDLIRSATKQGLSVTINLDEYRHLGDNSTTPIITFECSISPNNID